MKKIRDILVLFFIILCVLFLIGCGGGSGGGNTDLTHNSSAFLMTKVNGSLFQADDSNSAYFETFVSSGSSEIIVNAIAVSSHSPFVNCSVGFVVPVPTTIPSTYSIGTGLYDRGLCLYFDSKRMPYTSTDGNVTITSYDGLRCKGTFWFKAYSDSGAFVSVTEGSFDLPFNKS